MKISFDATFLRVLACLALCFSSTADATGTIAAVEYYDAGLDHYFITADPGEISALNSGRFFGWAPTGLGFSVLPPDSAVSGSTPVCRFYGNPAAGLDSHFYSASPAECQAVIDMYPGSWSLESWNVFHAYLPDATTGACPTDTTPIYRLWNHRPDVNHRYTDRADVALAMKALGYVPEGYGTGVLPVAFCAPAVAVTAMSCSVGADSSTPPIGSNLTLTALCSGSPTQFDWLGCSSSTESCSTTSNTLGGKSYVVTASNAVSASSPSIVSVVWQIAQAGSTGSGVACSVTTSNAAPFVNTSVTLTAVCTGNPTNFSWSGCASSKKTCTATSPTVGSKNYSVTASNSVSTSTPTTIAIGWQAIAPPPIGVSCTLDSSNIVPFVGSSITLTATCSGNPTSFTWVGCTSSTNTCVASPASAGAVTYSVTAGNATSVGPPAAIGITWQATTTPPPPPPPPPIGVSCALAASNTVPIAGTTVTLTAACTGSPTSFTWTGCASSTAACSDTSATSGSKSYSVTASNGTSVSQAATIAVNWQVIPLPPPGMPTSADFVARAPDPRGGDNGYNTFKRLPDGRGISFGGFSHDRTGNNAVAVYNPVANSWQITVPNTPWTDGPMLASGSLDVTGRTYLGNRDNHNVIVVSARNEFWALTGQRGIDLLGNWRGALNTQTWKWQIDDDDNNFAPVGSGVPFWINSAAGWIDSLGVGYIFGGAQDDKPYDGLVRIDPNSVGPAPFTLTQWANPWGNASFPGSEKLRYISNSHWVRNGKVHVYGGGFESHTATDANGNMLRSPNFSIYEIDVMAPSMRVFATNNLPDGQRVQGEAIIADRDPVKDVVVITDGIRVNAYDYTSGVWANIPVNTATDSDRQSPSADGAGRQGFYSPEAGQLLILGGHGHVYGLQLNYSTQPAVSCTLTASSSSAQVGTSDTLTASCSGNPTSYAWTGCASSTSSCVATSATTGSQTYSVTASRGTSNGVASVAVNWTAASPPPPPPPPSNPGNRTVTTTAVPYTGPMGVLGLAKHLDFARLGNRWYKLAGDHGDTGSPLDVPIPPPGLQDGQQVILSFNVAANDGREDTPYYLPASYGVQGANPDDAMAIVVGNEAWVMNTATNRGPLTQPANAAQQVDMLQKIMAYSPPSTQWPLGHWRVVGDVPWPINGDRAWRGFLDPTTNRIIIPTNRNGAVWTIIDATTAADLTRYAAGVPYQFGDYIFSVAGVVPDFTTRTFYVYDVTTHAIYSVDMDNPGGPTKVVDLPEPVGTTQSAIKLTWDPDIRAIVVAATKLHIYEIDSGKLTTVARPDGFVNGAGNYVPTSTIFFDPDTHDIVSIGTIDWDTGINPHVYWRLKIQ